MKIEEAISNESIKLDASDVYVQEIERAECEHCNQRPVTHIVQLDVRNVGELYAIARACESCANDLRIRISNSLPVPE